MRGLRIVAIGSAAVVAAVVALGVAEGVVVRLPLPARVLYWQGEVIRAGPAWSFPRTTVTIPVPFEGAVLVGEVHWDHSSAAALSVALVGEPTSCPAQVANETYYGPAWNETFGWTLAPGIYSFGAICGGWGNATVTTTIELVYG